MKQNNDTWTFPPEAVLTEIFNYVRTEIEHDQIMEVALWTRVEKDTGVATIMLSTVCYSNLHEGGQLFVRNVWEIPICAKVWDQCVCPQGTRKIEAS